MRGRDETTVARGCAIGSLCVRESGRRRTFFPEAQIEGIQLGPMAVELHLGRARSLIGRESSVFLVEEDVSGGANFLSQVFPSARVCQFCSSRSSSHIALFTCNPPSWHSGRNSRDCGRISPCHWHSHHRCSLAVNRCHLVT